MDSAAPILESRAPGASSDAKAEGCVVPRRCPKIVSVVEQLAACRSVPCAPSRDVRTTCPTAAIGKQLAAVCDLLDEMESVPDRDDDAVFGRSREHLSALRRHLLMDVEWVTPTSLEGLMVVAFAMRDVVEGFVTRAGVHVEFEESEDEMRFNRIMQRMIEGLGGLAGQSPNDMGLRHFWSSACAVAPDRSAFAHQHSHRRRAPEA